MFLVTSIAMLRERTTGTLERLMTLPLAKLDLLAGYGDRVRRARGGAGGRRLRRRLRRCSAWTRPHGAWLVGLLAVANALLGMALGLFVSAFARTEFQAVQFMPAFIFPQLLLCGLFVAARRDGRAAVLGLLGAAADLRLRRARPNHANPAPLGSRFAWNVAAVIAFMLASLALGAVTLRRRTE